MTNASTTGLVDACRRPGPFPLLERLRTEIGLDLDGLLPDIIEPGTVIGTVRPEAADIFGPDGRPTPSSLSAATTRPQQSSPVPATDSDFAYVSHVSRNLVVGRLEPDEPVLTEASDRQLPMKPVWTTVRYLRTLWGSGSQRGRLHLARPGHGDRPA